jgi:hypothetical protein
LTAAPAAAAEDDISASIAKGGFTRWRQQSRQKPLALTVSPLGVVIVAASASSTSVFVPVEQPHEGSFSSISLFASLCSGCLLHVLSCLGSWSWRDDWIKTCFTVSICLTDSWGGYEQRSNVALTRSSTTITTIRLGLDASDLSGMDCK